MERTGMKLLKWSQQEMMKAWVEGEMLGMGQGDRVPKHFRIIKRMVREYEVSKTQGCAGAGWHWLGRSCTAFPNSLLRDVMLRALNPLWEKH